MLLEDIDLSQPSLSAEEQKNIDEAKEFLETNGLGKYFEKLRVFGVRQTKDMFDPDLLNDDDLRNDIGMSGDDIQRFRNSVEITLRSSLSSSEVLELDVFVTRPGPLGVRLRYHRLIQTPYIALWEDSNQPNPGPLLSALLKLKAEDAPFVPEVGDVLVAVNGECVVGLPLEGAVDVIRSSAVKGGDRVLRFRRTNAYERAHVDGKQTMQPILNSVEDPWKTLSRYDAFDQALGKIDGMVEDRAVRQLSAGGCPEETGIRGIVWRYLLDQLPEKRSDWALHLEKERALYIEFSKDLFKEENRDPLKAAASSIQSMQNDKMYEAPPKPVAESDTRESNAEVATDSTQSDGKDNIESLAVDADGVEPTEIATESDTQESNAEVGTGSTQSDSKDNIESLAVDADGVEPTEIATESDTRESNAEVGTDSTQSDSKDNIESLAVDADGVEPTEITTESNTRESNAEVGTGSKDNKSSESAPVEVSVGIEEKPTCRRLSSEEVMEKVKKGQIGDEELDEDEFLLYEISKDVVRTHPDLQFFLDATHGPARYESIKRVLFVYAKLNPGVKYVQGMNELLGALFYVLAAQSPTEQESEELAEMFHPDAAEADAFNCFTVLMGELRDVFVEDLDDSSTGIKGRMAAVDSLLARHDPQLHSVLVELGVDPTFYTLRWITTLLSREFDLPDTLRLWDAFLAQAGMKNREVWLAYFCVAMIVGIRHELLEADFGTAIHALQDYPPTAPSIEDLLETANTLRKQDAEVDTGSKTIWPWTGGRPLSESLSMGASAERWSTAARQSAVALAAKASVSVPSSSASMMGAARSWWSKRGQSDVASSSGGDRSINSDLSRSMSEGTSTTLSGTNQSESLTIEPLSPQNPEPVDSDSDEFEDEDVPLKR